MASLSNHRLIRFKALGNMGKLTLGIYAVHFAFVDMLGRNFRMEHLSWMFFLFAVCFLSISTALLLSKNRLSKKLVM